MAQTVRSTHELVHPAQEPDTVRAPTASEPSSVTADLPERALEPAAPRPEPTSTKAENWAPFVAGAMQAAVTLFASHAMGSIVIASLNGSEFEVRTLAGFIPYAGLTQADDFLTTVTWSTVFAVAVSGLCALFMLWRRREAPLYVLGWASALPMGALLLGLQYLRHMAGPPTLDLWVAAQAAAFVAAASILVLAFHPPLAASGSTVPLTPSPSSRGKHAKEPRS